MWKRFKQPSTWAGLAALCVGAAVDFPELASVAKACGLVAGALAVVMNEGAGNA